MATTKEIRISQLPLEKNISGLSTIGVNSANQSVKIPIGEVINEEISKVKRTYGYSRIDALTVGSSADDVASALIAENESKRTMPNVGDILVDWGGVIRVPVVRQTVQTGGEKPIYSFSFRTADNTATKTVTIQGFLYEPQTVVSVETVKDVTQQQISTLDTQLAEEATARLNQDDVLEAKITEEKNARTEADTAINAEIATVKDSVVGKKSKTWNGFAEVFNNINENKATADCAHAEGTQTTASGQAAHAEGKLTVASKPYTHAEGDQTQATSSSSHSEGYGTRASGYASHAEGGSTVAAGNFTHAGGEHTKAANYAEQAIGYYNKSTYVNNNGQWKGDSESTLFSVGNGTSESDRKNALEVKQDGTVLVQKPGTKEMAKVYDGLMTAEERDKFFDLVADIEGLEDVDETSSWLRYKRCDSSVDFATINTATAEKHGLMSKSDKATLDALPTQLTAEQTAREQADTAINGVIQGIKDNGTLHDLFLGFGAEYDNSTRSYTYCDNTGLSLDDLIQAYYCTYNWWNAPNGKGTGSGIMAAKCIFRPKDFVTTYYKNYNFAQAFNNLGVKIIDLSTTMRVDNSFKVINVSSFDFAFQGSTQIEEIRNVFDVSKCDTIRMSNALAKCKLLLFKNVKTNINVKDLPLLNKRSILYMISNASPSSPITITLHPTAYAMATADPEIQAELEKQPNISLAEGEPIA